MWVDKQLNYSEFYILSISLTLADTDAIVKLQQECAGMYSKNIPSGTKAQLIYEEPTVSEILKIIEYELKCSMQIKSPHH